jgi:hypothetical protein
MDNIFVKLDAWIVASMLVPLMLAAWGAGWWMGWRQRRADYEPPVSKFDDASLAVMGLLLGFTFSMAMVKHDQRRLMVVADSNAIGDFYTCATLLNEPVRSKLQAVIRDYAQLRFDLGRRPWDPSRLESALPRMRSMQGQMTELVAQALQNGTPISVSLTNTLNGVTSNHAARLAAIRDPPAAKYYSAVIRGSCPLGDVGWPSTGSLRRGRNRWHGLLHPAGQFHRLCHARPESARTRVDHGKTGTIRTPALVDVQMIQYFE